MRSNTQTRVDAIALLKKDHTALKRVLSELKASTTRGLKKRQALLADAAEQIKIHARIEEEIFYPAYHAAAKTHDDAKLFFEAAEEHGLVDVVLPELESEDPASEEFGAKAKVLYDLIEHHAGEEEEEMFPRARKLLGTEQLKQLGDRMDVRKRELRGDVELTPKKGSGTRTARGGKKSDERGVAVAARN